MTLSQTMELCLVLGVFIPLFSFGFLAFWGPALGKPKASFVALAAIGISCVLSTWVLVNWWGMDAAARYAAEAGAYRFHWGDLGGLPITVGVKLDSLTVIMYFMVTFIAFWIHFFSIGYMAGHSDEVDGQSKYHRFFAYLSLFSFSMLGLVISSSLLFLFIFWELVGLCSYLLIGFYFERKYASDAAMKAFITNRVGDFGFIIGLAMVVLYMGTFDLDGAAANFAQQYNQSAVVGFDSSQSLGIFKGLNLSEMLGLEVKEGERPWMLSGIVLATLMGIGLFCGAMGKSAQFPLHVWLPDAMAGPTPVSALIHAATMVAAGVYLVARVFRLLTPDAQFFIAIIGCITLTLTALIALTQTDIKKILAYSTLSQLGYMIFGLGVGAWVAALFHLMTHAFFKAMLFLGSGQVIEGCHHEQEITKMGGLRKKMPVTCWTFFIGVLAIAGFGIPGAHLGLGGYFSKDEILAVAYERHHNIHGDHATDAHSRADREPGVDNAVQLASMNGASSSTLLVTHSNLLAAAAPAARGAAQSGGDAHGDHATGTPEKLKIAGTLPAIPSWMFWCPIIIAYVTPFYMMRCWWLTFMGKPRDHHVYDHAHESPMMYIPLAVLAVGTIFCSYWVFRPLIADAGGTAADASAVVAIDGEAHSMDELPKALRVDAGGAAASTPTMLTLTHGGAHDAHAWLAKYVGFSWIIGMGLAVLLYRRGLEAAAAIKRRLGFIATFVERKYYIDEAYDFCLVMGTRAVGVICMAFDKIVVDGLVNVTAFFTRGLGDFMGRQLDMKVKKTDIGFVDAVANGLANATYELGSAIRRPQNGRIRMYMTMAAGAAAIALLAVLFHEQIDSGLERLRQSLFMAELTGS